MSTEGDQSRAPVYTIAIGGAAGDGIREAGIYFSHFLDRLGFNVYTAFYYPSLIRGGHNFVRISFSNDKVRADHRAIDVLVATNVESVRMHTGELNPGALVFVDESQAEEARTLASQVTALPTKKLTQELKVPYAGGLAVALGAFAHTIGLSKEETLDIVEKALVYHRYDTTLMLAEKGYAHAESVALPTWKILRGNNADPEREVVGGNKATAMGFLAANLDFFFGYPMTPATSLMIFLAREATKTGAKVIHTEDEISAINMAIGASFAGKRSVVATGTGGFALMQEGFSLAGIAETPVVIAVSQRQGPATGVPTHTAQADLQFVIHSGHGEFPRFVFAPGDSEEAFYLGAEALNLAWEFQVPAVVLLDKTISESMETCVLRVGDTRAHNEKRWEDSGTPYHRYAFSDDGISPFTPPGTPNAVVKGTSYEHDEDGIATEDPGVVQKMQEKRFKKVDGMMNALQGIETVKTYGDPESNTVILCWGSTKGPVLEALRFLTKPVRVVQVICMEPFDTKRVIDVIGSAQRIIDIEGNHNAQLAALLREKTGIVVTDKILHYDSTPFSSHMIAEKVNALLS